MQNPWLLGKLTMGSNVSGERIRSRRKELNLGQVDVSEACKLEGVILDQGDISQIENGQRWVKDFELVAIANVLETTPDKLLGF